ncbi:MAG: RagB/SusD family nutrient uptake outer membrane protein [Bacteroides sp.]|nr:RagB/SusD family nutrient uptake outer membrane protein [Bacteroides sp.]
MKTKLYTLIWACAGILSFSACQDFLDPTPTDRYSDKIVWQNIENTNLYLNGFYTYVNVFSNFGSGHFGGLLTDGLTDQLKYACNTAGGGNSNLYAYEPTRITPDQNSLGIWNDTYDRIRRVNEFLEGLEMYAPYEEEVKTQFEAQARFFRAYLYHQLMIRHKSVILLDRPATQKDNPRATESEGWDFIEKDLDFAAGHMPVTRSGSETGRLTKGAVLGFKSRCMLFAQRWDKAKQAAQECIDLKDSNGAPVYQLATAYKDAFGSYYTHNNKEAVLEFTYADPAPSHNFDKKYVPGGDYPTLAAEATPTQEMVEAYELAGGGRPDWSKWHGTTTETPPYEQLEPRFHASILYNGCDWKDRTIEAYVGGTDGWMQYGSDYKSNGNSTTGYFLRKYLDEANREVATTVSVQPWIEIRLAEVYLNLAEAAARSNDNTTANNALRTVRSRVGLPHTLLQGDALMEAIRNERHVELAFEGHRYWDLRRWERATIELNNVRFHGLKITRAGDGYTYEYVEVDNQDRIFLPRVQQSFPIPTAELANNLAVTQLDEWK